jgi:hypothetical protein
MDVVNTITYYDTTAITAVKSFVVQPPGVGLLERAL